MRLCAFACAAVAACGVGTAGADDAPKRSPELQVLDRYAGDWDVVSTTGTGEKGATSERRTWSRQGTFLMADIQGQAPNHEAHFLITYDPKGKVYRSCFINQEFTVPLVGTWDEKAQAMRWKSPDIEFKHDAVNRFVDKDTIETRMTVTSPEGKVVFEMSAKQTRRKK